ncbi:MAG TPA: polysaccharide deacetylase family protein [Epulopiscium sp.]|nr:polysaccharide deacetylase family protein [Candidatus Epulonipiscium sp.]
MARTERRQRKKGISPGIFLTMMVIFAGLSFTMLWSLQVKASEVQKTEQILQIEQQQNKELQLTIEKMQKENEETKQQMEQLKKEVEELELKNLSKAQNEKEATLKIAYLTFDDGPSGNTPKILDILKEKNIPATFFVVGNQEMKATYKRIVDEGHTLGNHTYGHDYKGIYKSTETFFADVEKLNDLLEETTGQRSKILRFPGGSNNTVSRHAGGKGIMNIMTQAVLEEGYRYFDWNVDSQDASKAKQSKDVIVKSVLSGANHTNKAVILMHDAPAKTTTVDALPEIIDGLTQKGFIFRGLDMNAPAVQF